MFCIDFNIVVRIFVIKKSHLHTVVSVTEVLQKKKYNEFKNNINCLMASLRWPVLVISQNVLRVSYTQIMFFPASHTCPSVLPLATVTSCHTDPADVSHS